MSAERRKSSEGARAASTEPTLLLAKGCVSIPVILQITGLLNIKERPLLSESFLICVAACVDRQVLENRGVNVQEPQGVLHCVVCFMNALVI